jgi:hypothetical protein
MTVRAYCALLRARMRLSECVGQGTVEYVALMLLVAAILGAVIAAGGSAKVDQIPTAVANKLKSAIEGVGAAKP